MSEAKLSLCMIIRDEAAHLPGFLASVAGLWDELVVADTGSTDGSPDLVRAAGGTIVEFPWCDDFAAARNASVAAAGGRWILFLDADERIDAELTGAIRRLVEGDPRAGAATVVMRNALADGGRTEARLLRLFLNSPAIRFRHRVHEDVADDVAAFLARERLELRDLPGGVDHLGYARAEATSRNKKDRDLRLLRLALVDDPQDLYCRFKLLELARFWNDRDLASREVEAARRAFEAAPVATLAGRAWADECAALIAQFLPVAPEAAVAWLDGQAARMAAGPAWLLRRGTLAEGCGRLDEAAHDYEESLRLATTDRGMSASPAATRALLGLCHVAVLRRDLAEAGRLAVRAVEGAPDDAEALLAVANFTPPAEAAAFLARHARRGAGTAAATARALLTSGRPELALAVLGEQRDDPRCALGAVVVALVTGNGVDVSLDLDQATADAELSTWLEVLWNAPRAGLRDAFVERAGALAEAFPWVPAWVAARQPAAVSPSPR